MSLMVELDVDGLVAACSCLARIDDYTDGHLDQVTNADGLLSEAIKEIEEEGEYEPSLQTAVDLVDDAAAGIAGDMEFLISMHQAGRIRRSSETVEAVVTELRTALGHIGEWADLARSELRSLR